MAGVLAHTAEPLRVLVRHGVRVTRCGQAGLNPLHVAAYTNNSEAARFLLGIGTAAVRTAPHSITLYLPHIHLPISLRSRPSPCVPPASNSLTPSPSTLLPPSSSTHLPPSPSTHLPFFPSTHLLPSPSTPFLPQHTTLLYLPNLPSLSLLTMSCPSIAGALLARVHLRTGAEALSTGARGRHVGGSGARHDTSPYRCSAR